MATNSERAAKIQEITIEKNVPLSERLQRNTLVDVAKKMEVGDSVFSTDTRLINGIMTALNKSGFKASTRQEGEGRRVWRVS